MLLHFRILKGSWAALACSSITLYTDGFLLLLYIYVYMLEEPHHITVSSVNFSLWSSLIQV
jgi:hypothetical protein